MRKHSLLALIFLVSHLTLRAGQMIDTETPFPVKVGGLILVDTIFDTNQVVSSRDNVYDLFPVPVMLDVAGNNISARGDFNLLAIRTRLFVEGNGPELWCAKTRAYVEGDFQGRVEIVNLFRLRHAFFELTWPYSHLLVGQTNHPFYFPEGFPGVVDESGGRPILPFVRHPQIRFTHQCNTFEIILAALGELDVPNDGPLARSTSYFRNAMIPNLHAQGRFIIGDHLFGAAVDYKRLVPRLVTDTNYQTFEHLDAVSYMAYAKFGWGKFAWFNKICYVANALQYDMIGGYAVASIDPITDRRTYAPLYTLSYGFDINYKGCFYEPGLWIGIAKSMGAHKPIITSLETNGFFFRTIYGQGIGIDTELRVAPRLRLHYDPLIIAAEIEYTRATFGTLDNCGRVRDTTPASNVRFMLIFLYEF